MKKRGDNKERLLRHSRFDRKTGCRIWTGALDKEGYGMMRVGYGQDRKMKRAHRVSYEEHKGVVPDGLLVLHECDRPACIEPRHLFLGTHDANVQGKLRKGRQARGDLVGRKGAQHWRHGRSGRPKLTAGQVAAIRAAEGVSGVALARQYGVTAGHIGRIRRGQRR